MEQIRIVLAEDHAVVREGTRHLLEREADLVVVGEAANGEEAIRLVGRLHPDIVIVDIAMPGMNGIEATRVIKDRWPDVSVLVLTAYDDDEYVFAFVDAGAAGYLLKDVPSQELVQAVRAVHAGEPVLHPAVMKKLFARLSDARGSAARPGAPAAALSPREHQVLAHAARGLTNVRIAADLKLSPRTVQTHLRNVFTKLNVSSRTEAVVAAIRHGLLDLPGEDDA